MNQKMGAYASLVLFVSVVLFALCMPFGFDGGSYFSSMVIAWSFVAMSCAYYVLAPKERKTAGLTGLSFAVLYAAVNSMVYFAQLTTVRLSALSPESAMLLDFGQFGLLFNLDMLGYAFMSLATFFISFTLSPQSKEEKWLKGLWRVHGIFAVSCIGLPMLGLFQPGMEGGDLIGTLVLEFWCLYFAPTALLSWRYFGRLTTDKP